MLKGKLFPDLRSVVCIVKTAVQQRLCEFTGGFMTVINEYEGH